MTSFSPGAMYTHEEIYRSLGVGNAGGIRVSTTSNGQIRRAVLLTSVATARIRAENPYHDRVEGDVLVYTGSGQEGNQVFGGRNKRLLEQVSTPFPIYGFLLLGSRRSKELGPKRWQFLGLLNYMRPIRNLLIQVQAKRWLHTVGRKEVAELRGSLLPHARGAVVTTSHFSKAAVTEAGDAGKQPIALVDGYDFARIVSKSQLTPE